jgi:glycosyltransferase involved in cell wall biosynthesis
MKNQTSIVFLWAEVNGYLEAVMHSLANDFNSRINVVHWDSRSKNSTQHLVGAESLLTFHARSSTSDDLILKILYSEEPDMIVVSGWMDKGYIKACREYKKQNQKTRIIACIDDLWVGSVRQLLGLLYYRLFYKSLFDLMWVSGQPQFSFAQRFGYDIESIIPNLYSADTNLYCNKAGLAKRFIFVGRFVQVKALNLLVDAYCMLPDKSQKEWPLILVGDGDEKKAILNRNNPNIKIFPFMQPEELRIELLKGGVGCLPSHKDQWGVVLHEYALMGLPILASTGCGATTEFLISGFNGYLFRKSDIKSLYRAMTYFTSLSEQDISRLSENSIKLGKRITSEISAASLLSVQERI